MSLDHPRIVLLYQSLLGIYGDHGNAVVCQKRLQWRGLDAELLTIEPGEPVPTDADLYLLGGGEDTAQITAVRQLKADGGLFTALDRGAVLFAVCAGYQICGSSFTIGAHDEIIEGLGLLDVQTRRGPQRAVGEVLHHWTRPDGTESLVTGFENHGGWTTLGTDATALADVEIGWVHTKTFAPGTQDVDMLAQMVRAVPFIVTGVLLPPSVPRPSCRLPGCT